MTTPASAVRQTAVGEVMLAQSAPDGETAGTGSSPQHRLTATGIGAAQAQRTGASRRIATATPKTSPASTNGRAIGTAAASTMSASGTTERAISAGSPGLDRTARTPLLRLREPFDGSGYDVAACDRHPSRRPPRRFS